MKQFFFYNFKTIKFDFPIDRQCLFQDPATSLMDNVIDLHHDIMFFILLLTLIVSWMLARIIFFFRSSKLTTVRNPYAIHNTKKKRGIQEIFTDFFTGFWIILHLIFFNLPAIFLWVFNSASISEGVNPELISMETLPEFEPRVESVTQSNMQNSPLKTFHEKEIPNTKKLSAFSEVEFQNDMRIMEELNRHWEKEYAIMQKSKIINSKSELMERTIDPKSELLEKTIDPKSEVLEIQTTKPKMRMCDNFVSAGGDSSYLWGVTNIDYPAEKGLVKYNPTHNTYTTYNQVLNHEGQPTGNMIKASDYTTDRSAYLYMTNTEFNTRMNNINAMQKNDTSKFYDE